MNIDELITNYRKIGYNLDDARSTVCQNIILNKISKSKFKRNITIKGGVVMHNLSNSFRRATQDLDLDFIKYSLGDKYIKDFIDNLNKIDDGIKIIIEGKIEELHHQDYEGKRIHIKLMDNYNNYLNSKLDIGVHKNTKIEQEEYYFDLNSIDGHVCLLINSKEQIFVEKLKSLLKFGARSTRYKDLFDFYYLITETQIDKRKLINIMNILIYKDSRIYENNIIDVKNRLSSILKSKTYRKNLSNNRYNWIDVSVDTAINEVLTFISNLEKENIKN